MIRLISILLAVLVLTSAQEPLLSSEPIEDVASQKDIEVEENSQEKPSDESTLGKEEDKKGTSSPPSRPERPQRREKSNGERPSRPPRDGRRQESGEEQPKRPPKNEEDFKKMK